MAQGFNMLPFLLEAFAENRRLYKDIDALYMKDKYTFYKLAKQSEFYDHPIICEGDIFRQEYGRKMLGILTACNDKPELIDEVFRLIQKGWPYIYHLVESEKSDVIDVFAIIKKAYRDLEEFLSFPDDIISSIVTIILFLAINFGKKVVPESEKFIFKVYMTRLSFYDKTSSQRLRYETIKGELRRKTDVLKIGVYDKFGVIRNFRDINPAKNEELKRLSEGFAFLFDTEFLSSPSLFDKLEFADKDIDEILASYAASQQNLSATEAGKFLVAGIYIKYLLKAYKMAKEHYFKYNRETMFVELESKEKENADLRQENEQLHKRIEEQQKQIEALKKAVDTEYARAREEFSKTIQNLQKENEQLKADLEADNNELIALRELAFSLQQKVQLEQEKGPSLADMCQAINSPTILIIGGHPTWQKQIKDRLPNTNIVSADMLGFDPSSLGKIELVAFNTAYLNHAMYYKIINFVRKNKIKVCYIANQNIEAGIKQMYYAFSQ